MFVVELMIKPFFGAKKREEHAGLANRESCIDHVFPVSGHPSGSGDSLKKTWVCIVHCRHQTEQVSLTAVLNPNIL